MRSVEWKDYVVAAVAAGGFLALPIAADAADLPDGPPMPPAPSELMQVPHAMGTGSGHGTIPAGVHGAAMVDAGKFMFSYTPMFMHMEGNYIGSSEVSPQTIVTTVPSKMKMGMMPEMYRIVPNSMDVQSHMFHAMYGVTDWLNVMVMGSYVYKTMSMTTFAGATGTTILGTSRASTSGFGDTTVSTMWRLYQDQMHHLHLNLGLSLPSGSTTETVRMLSPMNTFMTMRANYGMQLGTGTVDLLPGFTYTGHADQWSWGAAYRGRLALDNNVEGYHYGYQQVLTGWGGYTWMPGVTTTARVAGSTVDRIHGADPLISGLMQGTNPYFYGGKTIDLFGGLEIAGEPFGLGATNLAVEGGGPVFQELNGPQLGHAWQVNVALRAGF